ncbi:MAG: hypothetical protein IJK04_13745, partial [Kiritimatiellae bacterium]|nr:hypothetical protein [Kiritimatiellia bacterium]
MAFLLKIVEGPNKGAEIALVEGVAITLGKTDDCDVILADPTLPDAPLEISATADAVLVGGVPLEPFNVRTAGSTSIAVGPADAPWGSLVWPKPEEEKETQEAENPESEVPEEKAEEQKADDNKTPDDSTNKRTNEQTDKRKRRGCLGCLIAAVVILLILLLLGWFFRATLSPRAQALCDKVGLRWSSSGGEVSAVDADAPASSGFAIEKLANRYGLLLEEDNGRAKLTGNFATRAERLKATAEAYASRPGIDLDFSDDETFRTAAEDSLFTLTEGAMKVAVATNRYLHLTGVSESPATLQKTLEQLNSDLPKLRGFDVASVKLVSPASPMPSEAAALADKQSNRQTVKRP